MHGSLYSSVWIYMIIKYFSFEANLGGPLGTGLPISQNLPLVHFFWFLGILFLYFSNLLFDFPALKRHFLHLENQKFPLLPNPGFRQTLENVENVDFLKMSIIPGNSWNSIFSDFFEEIFWRNITFYFFSFLIAE